MVNSSDNSFAFATKPRPCRCHDRMDNG